MRAPHTLRIYLRQIFVMPLNADADALVRVNTFRMRVPTEWAVRFFLSNRDQTIR
jgi:hypothetical protein